MGSPPAIVALDRVEGRAEPSALLDRALAQHNGYRLRPFTRTDALS
jgi:hypothetical protein